MPRKCFWLDTCLVPLSLKHLRYQGCAKLLFDVFFSTCLCFESVTSLFPSYFLLFSCCSFNFFLEETIKQQFQPILMFPCPINIFSAFLLKTAPGILVQTNGLDYQCNGHLANQSWNRQKSGPNVTSYEYGEVVVGPVITLPICLFGHL